MHLALAASWLLSSLLVLPAIHRVKAKPLEFCALAFYLAAGFWALDGVDSAGPKILTALLFGCLMAAFQVWDKDKKVVQTMPRERPQPEQALR
jgi:hypothetical protein